MNQTMPITGVNDIDNFMKCGRLSSGIFCLTKNEN